jgi:hypothetical protein
VAALDIARPRAAKQRIAHAPVRRKFVAAEGKVAKAFAIVKK